MDISTILADSAAQVDRAKPVDADWQSPNLAWFEQFTESVLRQMDVAADSTVLEAKKGDGTGKAEGFQAIETSAGRRVEVWAYEGKIWVAVEANYAADFDRAQAFMTPMHARMLAQMLESACPEDAFADAEKA